jgi:hypothetical protein
LPAAVTFPEGLPPEAVQEALSDAQSSGQGALSSRPDAPGRHAIAYPIWVAGQIAGAVGADVAARDDTGLLTAMRQLQWGCAWVQSRMWQEAGGHGPAQASLDRFVLDMLALTLDAPDYRPAARALATGLADATMANRVSVAHVNKGSPKIVASSHVARIGQKLVHPRQVQAAMSEAVELDRMTIWPRPAGDLLAYDGHEALARAQSLGGIICLPLRHKDRASGVICLEFSGPPPSTETDLARLEAMATAVAPVLEIKRRDGQGLPAHALRSLKGGLSQIWGPDHAALKLSLLGGALLAGLFWIWTAPYAIVAQTLVEGQQLRAVSAQFDGFLAASYVRAGDQVSEGQLLAAFDDRDLRLERLQLVSEERRYRIEYELAMSEQNRADMRIAESRRAQAQAQLDLVEARLERAQLLAPFDGIVVAGDLSQQIGAALSTGDVLFEIAPAGAFRLRLDVPEDQIAELSGGETGQAVLASFPGRPIAFEVERILPLSEVVDGQNIFPVEAAPDDVSVPLRPGLRGVARIDMDERRVIWIWTRKLQSWVRMAVWRWS